MSKETDKSKITSEASNLLSSSNITDNPRSSLNHFQDSLRASDPVAEVMKSTSQVREMLGTSSAFV